MPIKRKRKTGTLGPVGEETSKESVSSQIYDNIGGRYLVMVIVLAVAAAALLTIGTMISNITTGETSEALGDSNLPNGNVPPVDDDKFIKMSKSEMESCKFERDNTNYGDWSTTYEVDNIPEIFYIMNDLCIIDIETKGAVVEFWIANPTNNPESTRMFWLKTHVGMHQPLLYLEGIVIPAKSKIKFSNKETLVQWIPNWKNEKAGKIEFGI